MAQLIFRVKNQAISRLDSFYVVAKSIDYLYAQFSFSEDWGTGTKTAIFKSSEEEEPRRVILEPDGTCKVPWEVLDYNDSKVSVSVFCGNRITANVASVRVHKSGYSDEDGGLEPPTPDVYAQIIERMDDVEQTVVDSAAAAAGSASSASSSAGAASGSAAQAAESASAAGTSAQAASSAASSAGQKATAAAGSASESASKASEAAASATLAARAVSAAAASAGEAAASATAASGSATTASTKAGEAAQSALEAGTSKTDAESAKNAAVQAKTGAEAARDAAQQAIAHGPIITDGYWYLWDQNTNQYVNSGVKAEVEVDDELDDQSENPVQNKVIDAEIGDLKAEINELSTSIAPVESSTTATAAHAVGELFMMGETLLVALSAIAVGDTITTDGGSPNAAVTTLSSKLLKDVQVNGTSVVNQGVANVPIASADNFGALKAPDGYITGLQLDSSGYLKIAGAAASHVKNGTNTVRPIVPSIQHESTFYGLAKAASDTTQSASSNAVGTYTDAAKVAIQKMLGIYEAPWELIREDTFTNETEANHLITVDSNGNPFELTDIRIMFTTPVQDVPVSVGEYGRIRAYYNQTANFDILYLGGYSQGSGSQQKTSAGAIEQRGGMVQRFMLQSDGNNSSVNVKSRNAYSETSHSTIWEYIGSVRVYDKIEILAVTGTARYKLYGKRKWS